MIDRVHKADKARYFSGTSGIVLPVPNKLAFPPEFKDKSRLAYYASLFNSLEVNSCFYKVPMAATVKKWAQEVPSNLRFTFKLYKGITHNKLLDFDETDVRHFMQVIANAGDKAGCLLVQFPKSTVLNVEPLEKLLQCIQNLNNGNAWKVCVEFRHPSWYVHQAYGVLKEFDATLVIHDMPDSATPPMKQWTEVVYLRYHGPAGDYRGSYTKEFLQKQALMINNWLAAGHTVYTYFNNTIGDAVENLTEMAEYVGKK